MDKVLGMLEMDLKEKEEEMAFFLSYMKAKAEMLK